MKVKLENREDKCFVTLSGRFEGFDYLNLQKEMDSQIKGGCVRFLLEMSAVEYISSTALATICSYLPVCEEKDGGMVIVGANERILSILECLKITALVPVVDSIESGLATFK